MEVRILFKSNGGTGFWPRPGRLHFLLPGEWAQRPSGQVVGYTVEGDGLTGLRLRLRVGG